MTVRTLVQFFHWYLPGEGHLWNEVAEKAHSLADMGLTDVWLPPAYKGAGAVGRLAMTPMTCSTWASLTRRAVSLPNMAHAMLWNGRRAPCAGPG
jgi:hypothetical protein